MTRLCSRGLGTCLYSLFPTLRVLVCMQALDFVSKSVACIRMKISWDNASFWSSAPNFHRAGICEGALWELFLSWRCVAGKVQPLCIKPKANLLGFHQVAEADAGPCWQSRWVLCNMMKHVHYEVKAFSIVPSVSLSAPFIVVSSYTNGCTSLRYRCLRKASMAFIPWGLSSKIQQSSRINGEGWCSFSGQY